MMKTLSCPGAPSISRLHPVRSLLAMSMIVGMSLCGAAEKTDFQQVAAEVDALILQAESSENLPLTDDAAFLRRLSLDLVGRPPSAGEFTRFGLDPDPDKRLNAGRQLLNSEEYAVNWSRYWRDAIFVRATNVRAGIVRPAFEDWMTANLRENRSWTAVVTDLLTATGPVNENGSTALIFAHEGEPEEIAAEASRLFLGIQIQCANCHDHPWDHWKREQFHQFVAFFPRISLRRDPRSDNMFDFEISSVNRDQSRRPGLSSFVLTRIDRNRDGFISEGEAKGSLVERVFSGPAKDFVDRNGDGRLSVEELRTAQPPDNNRPGQGQAEHYMPNLAEPNVRGTLIHPAFFADTDLKIPHSLDDMSRRETAAELITQNKWFATAVVNRLWSELTGTAFYTPIDDIGPDRQAVHEDALQRLADGFVANDCDMNWLFRTITATKIYQRGISPKAEGFVRCEPLPLRADQLYDSLCQTLNVTSLPLQFTGRRAPNARRGDPGRLQFETTFAFDPSTPRADISGSIPEALFLMNSPELETLIRDTGPNSLISRISRTVLTDEDVVRELYLATVTREPTEREVDICLQHISAADSRREGLENVLWSLINSVEYRYKS